jgi:hypothetical protein
VAAEVLLLLIGAAYNSFCLGVVVVGGCLFNRWCCCCCLVASVFRLKKKKKKRIGLDYFDPAHSILFSFFFPNPFYSFIRMGCITLFLTRLLFCMFCFFPLLFYF